MSRNMNNLPPALGYRRDQLWIEECLVADMVKAIGTPAYCYSRARVLENYQRFEEGVAGLAHQTLCAIKANPTAALIALLAKAGAGAEIVSGGELFRALRAGV